MPWNRINKSRLPAEGGDNNTLRLAICAAMLLLPVAAPGIQAIMLMFVPGIVACMLYTMPANQGITCLGSVFVAGSVISFMTGKPDSALWMVQGTGCVALILLGLRQGRDAPELFLQCVLFLCFTTVAAFLLASGSNAAEAYRTALGSLSDELESSIKLYSANAGQSGMTPEMTLLFQQVKETIIRFFPGIIMSSMVLTAFFSLLFCRRCLAGHNREDVPLSHFSQWRMPEWLVWPWIISGALCFTGHSLYRMIGENALLSISVIFLVSGISVTQFLLERFMVPTWIRWATWILVGLQWYGMLVLAALGIADVYVDFRKRFAAPSRSDTV